MQFPFYLDIHEKDRSELRDERQKNIKKEPSTVKQ